MERDDSHTTAVDVGVAVVAGALVVRLAEQAKRNEEKLSFFSFLNAEMHERARAREEQRERREKRERERETEKPRMPTITLIKHVLVQEDIKGMLTERMRK